MAGSAADDFEILAVLDVEHGALIVERERLEIRIALAQRFTEKNCGLTPVRKQAH